MPCNLEVYITSADFMAEVQTMTQPLEWPPPENAAAMAAQTTASHDTKFFRNCFGNFNLIS